MKWFVNMVYVNFVFLYLLVKLVLQAMPHGESTELLEVLPVLFESKKRVDEPAQGTGEQ